MDARPLTTVFQTIGRTVRESSADYRTHFRPESLDHHIEICFSTRWRNQPQISPALREHAREAFARFDDPLHVDDVARFDPHPPHEKTVAHQRKNMLAQLLHRPFDLPRLPKTTPVHCQRIVVLMLISHRETIRNAGG